MFGLSLVLIIRFAPDSVAQFPTDAFSTDLSTWVFGVLAVAAIITGGGGLIFRLMRIGASSERRSVLASRASAIEMIGPTADDGSKLPSVPRGSSQTDSPGERLTYRLAAETPEGGIAGPATLALLWNCGLVCAFSRGRFRLWTWPAALDLGRLADSLCRNRLVVVPLFPCPASPACRSWLYDR